MEYWSLFVDLLKTASAQVPGGMGTVLGITGTIFGSVTTYFLDKYFFKSFRYLNKQIKELTSLAHDVTLKKEAAELKLKRLNAAMKTDDIWSRKGGRKPNQYVQKRSAAIPITIIANLKGGVSKSTIAANLVAYFSKQGERVLAIDLDSQGSMSTLLLGRSPVDSDASKTEQLFRPDTTGDKILQVAVDAGHGLANVKLIPTYRAFDAFENKLMLKWLIGDIDSQTSRPIDARYFLSQALHDPIIRNNFDRIIIDAPPRMAAGFVGALCASTSLLIPTVLDKLSAKAVGHILNKIKYMEDAAIFPHIKLIGIIGTQSTNLSSKPQRILQVEQDLEALLRSHGEPSSLYLKDAFIPEMADIAAAAGSDEIAYLTYSKTQPYFAALGQIIKQRTN